MSIDCEFPITDQSWWFSIVMSTFTRGSLIRTGYIKIQQPYSPLVVVVPGSPMRTVRKTAKAVMKFDLEGWFPSQASADVGTWPTVWCPVCVQFTNVFCFLRNDGMYRFWEMPGMLSVVAKFRYTPHTFAVATLLITRRYRDFLLAQKFQFLWSDLIHRRYTRSWCLPFYSSSHVDILMIWANCFVRFWSPFYRRKTANKFVMSHWHVTNLSFHISPNLR